jgi:hypothetical protein
MCYGVQVFLQNQVRFKRVYDIPVPEDGAHLGAAVGVSLKTTSELFLKWAPSAQSVRSFIDSKASHLSLEVPRSPND